MSFSTLKMWQSLHLNDALKFIFQLLCVVFEFLQRKCGINRFITSQSQPGCHVYKKVGVLVNTHKVRHDPWSLIIKYQISGSEVSPGGSLPRPSFPSSWGLGSPPPLWWQGGEGVRRVRTRRARGAGEWGAMEWRKGLTTVHYSEGRRKEKITIPKPQQN